MALTVATLAGFPDQNTTFQATAGTPTVAATFAFTNGVYTQAGTQYVAGILDTAGVVPSRIFNADNGTGGGTQGTQPLPTLVSVTQVSASGESIQELPSRASEASAATGYAGFVVVMTPAEPSWDSGGPTGAAFGSVLVNVPPYTNATPKTTYPQPQMRFFVSMAAVLILASTQYG